MVRVKICGLTTLADAELARDAGADYLGFILFAGSRRYISAAAVAQICSRLRAAAGCPTLVGVFVNTPLPQVAATLDATGLDLAQLHGDEAAGAVTQPTSPVHGRAFKALRPQTATFDLAQAMAYANPARETDSLPSLLIDAYDPARYGGTGQRADWSIARRLARATPRLMLAGGLTPDNVGRAVAEVKPFGVDVAGGTERAPGRKDPALVRAFVANAKATR